MVSEAKPHRTSVMRITWELLLPRERRSLAGVGVLILIGMLLELLSLGLFVPMIALIAEPSSDLRRRIEGLLPTGLTQTQFLLVCVTVFILVFVIKTFFVVWSSWVQRGFSMRVGVRVQTETYQRYLSKPYEFHLQNNSAHLIRNIQNASSVINGGIDPFLVIATDGLVAIGLFTLLLVVEPAGTVVTLAFLTLGAGLLHVQSRRRLERWGRASNELTGEAQQALQEGLAGVKELLVLDRLRLPLAAFSTATERKGHIMRRYGVMQTVPRLWLEVLSMVSFGVLVLVLIAQNVPPTEMVTTLGLFAATAFRTMPSVNRISATFQSVRFNRPLLQSTYEVLTEPHDALRGCGDIPESWQRISFCNVTYRYPAAARDSLTAVTLEIRAGEFVGVTGESGAGKSTMVDVLLGLLAPTQGSLQVDGTTITGIDSGWTKNVGYVPQSIFLVDDSIAANIALGVPRHEIDHVKLRKVVHEVRLDDFVEAQSEGLQTVVGEKGVRMSGGQRQRIGIARALYRDPSLLVLDEATSALDAATESAVMDTVLSLKGSRTIVAIAHRTTTLAACDRIIHFSNGKVLADGVPSVVYGEERK